MIRDFVHQLSDFGYVSSASSSLVFKRFSNSTYPISCQELVRYCVGSIIHDVGHREIIR